MKTGKLKERTIKLIVKHDSRQDTFHYAEADEEVYWDGQRTDHPEYYGGRDILWCKLWSGESIGLEESEVEWDEAEWGN